MTTPAERQAMLRELERLQAENTKLRGERWLTRGDGLADRSVARPRLAYNEPSTTVPDLVLEQVTIRADLTDG